MELRFSIANLSLGPVLWTQQSTIAMWNVVGIRDSKSMQSSFIIIPFPNECPSVDVHDSLSTKAFDIAINFCQLANKVSYLVGDTCTGSIVNTNRACISAKWFVVFMYVGILLAGCSFDMDSVSEVFVETNYIFVYN